MSGKKEREEKEGEFHGGDYRRELAARDVFALTQRNGGETTRRHKETTECLGFRYFKLDDANERE